MGRLSCYTRNVRLHRSLHALLALLLAAPALAADDAIPNLFDYGMTQCDGIYDESVAASTGSPNFTIKVVDRAISSTTVVFYNSGFRVGRKPHVGGNSALSPTVLLLHLDEAAGVAVDSTTYGNTTSKTGGLTSPDGQTDFGKALYWDADDHLQIVKSASLNSTTEQMTFQTWVYPNEDPLTTERTIFQWGDDGGARGPYLRLRTNGSLYANMVTTDGVTHDLYSSPGVVPLNDWSLITLVYGNLGGGTKFASIYWNQTLVSSRNAGAMAPLRVSDHLYIGRNGGGGSNAWRGYIDEVRVLNMPLSQDAITSDWWGGQFVFRTTTTASIPSTIWYLGASSYTPAAYDGSHDTHTFTAVQVPLKPGVNNLRFMFQDMAGNTVTQDRSITVSLAAPLPPSASSATPLSAASINWTWEASPRLCTGGSYLYFPCSNTAPLVTGIGNLYYTEAGYGANSLNCRQIGARTMYGDSSLTTPTSAYTYPNPASAIYSSYHTTGSFVVSWNVNSNPGYTRWEMNLSTDNFVSYSTPIVVTANHVLDSKALTGLQPATTYYVRLRAINGSGGDYSTLGSLYSAYVSSTILTVPQPGLLVGTAQGLSSILWTWSAYPSAQEYVLVSSTGGTLVRTQQTSFLQTHLARNTEYGATLRIRNASGFSPDSNQALIFTLADVPGPITVTSASTESIGVSWLANGNPSTSTVYDLFIATDTGFAGNVSTRTVSQSSLLLSGLLPSTLYAVRVRAVNGNGVPTAPSAAVTQRTYDVPSISSTPAPSSPYIPDGSAVGVWHFDEGSSTRAADSSGFGHHALLTCLDAHCISTPTFTSGMEGLGTAVQSRGVTNSLSLVSHTANLAGTGSMTVAAWVKPLTSAQVTNASIVQKGVDANESFGLGLGVCAAPRTSERCWRFFVRDSITPATYLASLTSTQSMNVGLWTHLLGVYDAGNRRMALYVNGVVSSAAASGAPAARIGNAFPLTIGNGQYNASSYIYPFNGAIDDVHLISGRAFSAAETATFYASYRSSEVVLPSPNAFTHIIVPPNAFGGAATIMVSSDPVRRPITVPVQTVLDALANPPTAHAMVPGTLIEVIANVGGVPFTGNLGSSASVSLPYPDADSNGLVDNTHPPMPASSLVVYTLDESVARWVALPTTVDTASKRAIGLTPHFSIFAVYGPSGIRPDVSSSFVRPNPWQPGSGGPFDSATFNGRSGIVFDNLPVTGSVKVFTLAGELVADLPFEATHVGKLVWDGRNKGGKLVASGVYFGYVKSSEGGATVLKFAIER
ncbi:MAG TPA: hypothetical protein DCM05_07405 [Elusimicrobia bacterium]|nr:hypothetical protein [Elusimicrobiota bacterium]